MLAIGTEHANLRFPAREQKADKTPGPNPEPFAAWLQKHSQTTPTPQTETIGVELARQRRKEMRMWIENDPQRAWENRISWRERQRLPAAVQAELEILVSATGDLNVFAATPTVGRVLRDEPLPNDFRPVTRTATIDGRKYEAFVYGRRVNQPSGFNVSLHGVALDDVIALSDSPVRLLEPGEPPSPGKKLAAAQCPISGSDATAAFAESGSRTYPLCSAAHVDALAEMVSQQELQATSNATTGAQSALVIIVDFPNLPHANTTRSGALEAMQYVDSFYRANSFGALSIGTVDVTPVIRLPQYSSTYYLQGISLLMNDAVSRAQALGYQTSNYRFVIATFVNIGFDWGGLGLVGGRDSFIQGPTFGPDFVEHELGHNLGVWHAGGWFTYDESVIGPGQHVEYGNAFDVMGSSSGHLNGAFKSTLGWLQESNIATATVDGTYRLYALDMGGELAPGKAYTLHIPAAPPLQGLPSDYWIDYRQQFADHGASSGALIHWATNSVGVLHSHLLDMNPGGIDGFRDGALRVGRTFVDNVRRICITPIAKGTNSLDLAIKFGPSNPSVPTLTLNASTLNANIGQAIQFTATATDSDGDTLAYYWDFDDESVMEASLNQPLASKSWSSPRDYFVRCVVSDMKGGQASASVLVQVGTPATYHIAGTVSGMAGVRVHNGLSGSDYRGTYTDGQGRFVLTGLPAGSYSLGAAKAGTSFKPMFANPVTVGPANVDGLAFEPHPAGAPLITGFSPSSGGIGTLVTIDGASLFGISSVTIGNRTTIFTNESVQRIRFRVPSEATTGLITVSNSAGVDSSVTAFVVIPSPPVITRDPLSQTNRYGTTANFFGAAEGSGPLSYQWRKDGVPIPSATSTNYSITNLMDENAGLYDFVASNPVGSVTSDPARLTLGGAPGIVEQPHSTNVLLGEPVVFSVRALGTPPLYYQWYRQWISVERLQGATNQTYVIPDAWSGDDYYSYYVVVSNTFGSQASIGANVFFVQLPSVQIVYPQQQTEVPVGPIEVIAYAGGPFPVVRVELFDGTNKLAESFQPEYYDAYRLVFTNNTPGQRLYLTARVTDSVGHQASYGGDDGEPVEIFVYLPLSAFEAEWKYLDDGSDPGPEWRTSFDDELWKTGSGYFGFGNQWDDMEWPHTFVEFGNPANEHVTTYFRRKFMAPDPAELSNIVMRATHTGGMIVYLNDREILRSRMPTGAVDYLTLAASDGMRYEPTRYDRKMRLDPAWLLPGENRLAVEVHLNSRQQDSMVFNLRLLADLLPRGPEISIVYPQSWQLVAEPQFDMRIDALDFGGQITNVTFSADSLPFAVLESPPYSVVISNLPPFAFCKSIHTVTLHAFLLDSSPDSAFTYPVYIIPPSRPGYVNILSERNAWTYDAVGIDSGTAWRDPPGPAILPGWNECYTPYSDYQASTTRFRKVFEPCVPPGEGTYWRVYTNLTLYLLTELSDGAIVYLNGTEVFRYNLPPGPITNGTFTGLPPSVFGYVRADIDPSLLQGAANLIAVEMYQNQTNSENLVFDLALVGTIQPSFPGLRMHMDGGSLVLEWDEFYWYSVAIEQADTPNGPWYWLDHSTRDIPIYPGSQRFFRLRWDPVHYNPD